MEDGGRSWGAAVPAQEGLEPLEAGRGKRGFFLRAWAVESSLISDFWPPESSPERTMRDSISVVLCHQVCDLLLWQP